MKYRTKRYIRTEDGTIHAPGETVELAPEVAAGLGSHVELVAEVAPPAPPPPEAPRRGRSPFRPPVDREIRADAEETK